MTEQTKKPMEEMASSYVKHCQDNDHAVYGIAEAYCKADYKAGFTARDTRAEQEIAELKEDIRVLTNNNKELLYQRFDLIEKVGDLAASLKSAVDILSLSSGAANASDLVTLEDILDKTIKELKAKHPDIFKGE